MTIVIQLIVTDSMGAASQPDQVVISTWNSAPIAEAGLDQAITLIGTTVQLDGNQSYDPDGDPITYEWTFASMPPGSNATLTNANTATPSFLADVYGTYLVRLIVRDPWTESWRYHDRKFCECSTRGQCRNKPVGSCG